MSMEKIGILVDSASDVPVEVLQKNHNIELVPLNLTIDGINYLDRIDIQPAEFYEKLRTCTQKPQTASPSIGTVMEKIASLKKRGYTKVVALTISSGLSVTNQVFKQATAEIKGIDIEVIDTKNIGIGSGLFIIYTEELIQAGLSFDMVVQAVNKAVPRSHVYFYIPTLDYLRAGGRIGRVAGLIGSILNIKPIISCDPNGIYYPIAKARSESKAIAKMIALAIRDVNYYDDIRIGITHGANEPLMDEVIKKIRLLLPEQSKIYTTEVSPALGVHTGPGLIGIAVQAK